MATHEGTLLTLGQVPATEAAAEAMGRAWLAEKPEAIRPLIVAYRDVEGTAQLVWIDEPEWRANGST
jgi:hypothetical protein